MKHMAKVHVFKILIGRLYLLLSKKHRLLLIALIMLTIVFSLVETLGISAIMPFISAASNPGLLDSGWYKKAYDLFGFITAESFIIALGIAIICFYMFRAVYSIGLTWLINRYSQGIYKYLSGNLFRTFLAMPYTMYAQKNSADLVHILTGEANRISTLVLNILQLCTEFFTIALVYILMLIMNWQMTLVVTVLLSVIVLALMNVILKTSKAQGEKRIKANIQASRALREAFGNFKFVRLKGAGENIFHSYATSIAVSAHAEITSNTLGQAPKGVLESIGFSLLVAAVIFILRFYHDASKVIPLVAMYALALYRILPAVHRMLQNLNSIAYSQHALEIVDEHIHLPVKTEGSAPVVFEKSIRLENISFKYASGNNILSGVSLEIHKGDKIAISGESGSGKSTLADLIIGIHTPVSGTLYIDNTAITDDNIRSWRGKIGYIPQNIYLFDGTVAENIVFGAEPDEARIKQVLQMANIWDFLSTKDGMYTRVGEGGVQLSGGQQQRVGIARALYDNPDVLVLDEATSALDTETETKIMDEIYDVSRHKTLIVVAHRLSTVARCERKIRLENGGIVF